MMSPSSETAELTVSWCCFSVLVHFRKLVCLEEQRNVCFHKLPGWYFWLDEFRNHGNSSLTYLSCQNVLSLLPYLQGLPTSIVFYKNCLHEGPSTLCTVRLYRFNSCTMLCVHHYNILQNRFFCHPPPSQTSELHLWP